MLKQCLRSGGRAPNSRRPIIAAALGVLLCGSLHAQAFAPIPALSFEKPFAGADPLPQSITVVSTAANLDINHTESTSSGGSWLSVTVEGTNCCTTPRVLTVK